MVEGGSAGAGGATPARGRGARRSWLDRLVPVGARLITAVLWFYKRTLRRRLVNPEDVFASWSRGERLILAFWHEQLVLMPSVYTGPRVCIMVSRHRDGELISRAVRPLGIDTVRGSSTRGWSGALKGMLRAHRDGSDLAFAPDGPRGPRRVAKSGVIQIARATGATIVPVAAAARWCRRLGSWDRLVVPVPGSRVVYMAGTMLRVPTDAGPAEVEAARVTLERELGRITDVVEAAAAA